jgi:hypothetical protein
MGAGAGARYERARMPGRGAARLALVVLLLLRLLAPLRRWLETFFARRLRRGRGRRRADVVVLERREDGTFGREGRDGR